MEQKAKERREEPEAEQALSFGENLFDWAESLVVAVIWVVLVFVFVARLAGVRGESMEPTLDNNDWVLVNQLSGRYERGDIVVVLKPTSRNEPLIKRVIAVGGETIDIDFNSGIVTVDGRVLDEPYTFEQTYRSFDMQFPQTVPEGHVFVMGDNRNNSWDSRDSEVGMVDSRYVLGKVPLRVSPLSAFGIIGYREDDGEHNLIV